jgi:hypothetical protein
VIARQFVLLKLPAAVLALVLVPGVDIFSRILGFLASETNKAHQPDDRRDFHGNSDGPHNPFGFLDDFDFVEEDEFDRALPVDDVQRLVRCIQQQDLFEEISLLSGIVPATGRSRSSVK